MVIVLSRNGFGNVKEVASMDLLSFRSACEALGRVCEKENAEISRASEPKTAPAAPVAPGPRPKMTKDQANLDMLSRVKVKRG